MLTYHSKIVYALACITMCMVQTTIGVQAFFTGYGGWFLTKSELSRITSQNTYGISNLSASFDMSMDQSSPALTGGLKYGFWAHHFGAYLDANYNTLNRYHKNDTVFVTYANPSNSSQTATTTASVDFCNKRTFTALSFMFAVRQGLLTTPNLPCGIVQPYLGIGPAVFFTKQLTKLIVGPNTVDVDHFSVILPTSHTLESSKKTKTAFSFAIDAGIQCMLGCHFLLDTFFRYRLVPRCPTESICLIHKNEWLIDRHLFTFQVGLGYSF
ncbi:MAG: hypothetical protein UU47_C0003G0020 [candidate division TM6 bacterium GW2011_GWE2_41_16]|nr:MAG: hypothetical protein UU47_C0003G0020 [candidate division TM6 bacterium GW2011_GWE2_41_16]